jgi:hypothetical protein
MLRKNTIGTYTLKGREGKIFNWTCRALQRIGLVYTETDPLVVINIPTEEKNMVWKVEINSKEKLDCSSLYELTAELSKRLTGL